MKNKHNSEKLYQKASEVLVGGVNSPVRAFKNVDSTPLFISRAQGSHIWDADGNEYIDYVGTWGPAILGHAHPDILRAIHETMRSGTSFGASTAKEIEIAQLVQKAFPSMELMRFVNSGTEATMSALRVARGYTKRKKIIKFDGCYHGHVDSLLVKAGSGAETLGIPDSAGIPEEFAALTLIADFNDSDSVKKLFQENPGEIAAIIVEPIMGNLGFIPPENNFLQDLREICTNEKTILIFDEVMTGFRVAFGGAQEIFNVKPDMTCLGKIIGGGLPVGAYGGKKEIMEQVAPLGAVYQAGTLSGNPLAVAAGLANLKGLQEDGVYERLSEKGDFLCQEMKQVAEKNKVDLSINHIGSMFSFFFNSKKVNKVSLARSSDGEKFKKVFHGLLQEGVYLAPSPFEAGFISLSHSQDDLNKTVEAWDKSLFNL